MPVVRLLFFVLLLVNAIAFMLLEGWLGSSAPRGEPERLTNQLRPGQIVLGEPPEAPAAEQDQAPLSDPAAIEAAAPANAPANASADAPADAPADAATSPPEPAHKAAAPALPAACVRFAGLSGDQASDMIERARRASKALTIDDARAGTPNGWWVYVPPQGSRDAADGKVAELRALGVKDLYILQDAGPNQYAVSLGVFKTETSARQMLGRLQAQGVRSARVSQRNSETHRIEISGPGDVVSNLASELGGRYPGATRLGCTP